MQKVLFRQRADFPSLSKEDPSMKPILFRWSTVLKMKS